jgi:hypothetical protein
MTLGFASRRAARPLRTATAQKQRESDELYEMANLFPRTTGLPMVVWVSPKGRARHGPRVKVSTTPGKMGIGNSAVVGIRPRPRLIEGDLATADPRLVSDWIVLNEAALMDLWNEKIDAVELGERLKKI